MELASPRVSAVPKFLCAASFPAILRRTAPIGSNSFDVMGFVMPSMLEKSMTERPNKSSEYQEKPSVSAVELSRARLCDLCGPRGWNDTRESWLARGARKAGLTLRRARALFYSEPIRLDADEYLAIERAHQGAVAAVATLSILASDADLCAARAMGTEVAGPEAEGGPADRQERRTPDASVAARGPAGLEQQHRNEG